MSYVPRYLLDANIVSHIIRQPTGIVVDRIKVEGEHSICTSIVVAAELRFGAEKKGSVKLKAQMEAVLSAMNILPLEEPVDRHYAEIRDQLDKQGTPIGPNDLWIAAQAMTHNLTVVTANTGEFQRVSGLTVENWL